MTLEFQEISQGVRDVQHTLEQGGYTDLTTLLHQVQQQEREKLHTTLALQALRAAHAHRKFSWQLPNGEEVEAGVGEDTVSVVRQHTCGHGCGHGGAAATTTSGGNDDPVGNTHTAPDGTTTVKTTVPPPSAAATPPAAAAAPLAPSLSEVPQEPSKAEYEAAVKEAICSMQVIVTSINELLEEVAAAAEEAAGGEEEEEV